MRYLLLTLLSAAALVFSASTHAQGAGISGAWVFERATDIDGPIGNQTNDLPPTLQILGDSFVMPKGCAVRLQREPASTGDVFQSLYKADVTEDQIATFYQKQFNLNIRDKKAVFRKATLTDTCYPHVGYFFQQGDKLVVSQAGGNFMFLYKRIIPIQSASGEGPYSQLPFHRGTYRILCPKGVTWSGRKPVNATTRCAPLYFPRIAMASSTDAIARLVGHHNYEGPAVGGQALSNDYSDPVGSGFRPIYQSLPPKGDIALVHVTDDELSESRDTMTGAYLSIRNGKVVSQLNSNCTMGLDYVCREMNSPVRYTLNEKGEFVEHTR